MPRAHNAALFADTITTGLFKGKRLILPENDAQRPTRNRVRQAVFNMLESRIVWQGARALDACTGSGAWGLEALSRGATHVTLLDTDTTTAALNVKALATPAAAMIVQADATVYTPTKPYDVVLADPPYGSPVLQSLLNRRMHLGHPGSLWALEYGSSETPDWQGFTLLKTATYGISTITLLAQL